LHCFVQHSPTAVQTWLGEQPQSLAQLAQFSPVWHAELPQTTSCTHCPLWQEYPLWHDPQEPPQPSEPQVLPLHCLVQHCALTQVPDEHAQSVQFAHVSPAAASHVAFPHVLDETQLPFWQIVPEAQEPHTPPQPSSPQALPLQLGVQHWALTQVPPLHAQSSGQLSHDSLASHVPSPQDACDAHLPLMQTCPLGHP
jgi:hypothetical protein